MNTRSYNHLVQVAHLSIQKQIALHVKIIAIVKQDLFPVKLSVDLDV